MRACCLVSTSSFRSVSTWFCKGQHNGLREETVAGHPRCAHLWAMAAMAVTSFRAHRVAGISGRVGMRKSFQAWSDGNRWEPMGTDGNRWEPMGTDGNRTAAPTMALVTHA